MIYSYRINWSLKGRNQSYHFSINLSKTEKTVIKKANIMLPNPKGVFIKIEDPAITSKPTKILRKKTRLLKSL